MQAMLCRTVGPSTAVHHCLAITLCCVYMVIQVLETFVKVKCTAQCTQGNINCPPTCNVKHTLHMEAQCSRKSPVTQSAHINTSLFFYFRIFFAKLQKFPAQLGTLGQWPHSEITN